MQLHDLQPGKGKKRKSLRIWRGNASTGNYSGRGCKGQKARSWGSVRVGFEWGQTPLFKRLPKNKGFKRNDKLLTKVASVNLLNLEKDIDITDGMELTMSVFIDLWYAKKSEVVKILWKGELKKKLTFASDITFSQLAKDTILKVGGTIAESS